MTEWLGARARRAEQRAETEVRAEKAADPDLRERREAWRQANVAAGLRELELWLCDLVRHGLAAAHAQPRRFWEAPTARMVDAQAPGVARLLREMAGIPCRSDKLLRALSRIC